MKPSWKLLTIVIISILLGALVGCQVDDASSAMTQAEVDKEAFMQEFVEDTEVGDVIRDAMVALNEGDYEGFASFFVNEAPIKEADLAMTAQDDEISAVFRSKFSPTSSSFVREGDTATVEAEILTADFALATRVLTERIDTELAELIANGTLASDEDIAAYKDSILQDAFSGSARIESPVTLTLRKIDGRWLIESEVGLRDALLAGVEGLR